MRAPAAVRRQTSPVVSRRRARAGVKGAMRSSLPATAFTVSDHPGTAYAGSGGMLPECDVWHVGIRFEVALR
ncbi:hypothetical protein GCM10023083_75570 [Streptomyces phyllanthi]